MNRPDLAADVAVIGAGVVGLAVARRLAQAGREVLVLEAERAVGTHTSSRNSEVIHAGLYYPAGWLKATLCVEGRRQLYAYCADRGVAHRRLGKLIVATSEEEVTALDAYRAKGEACGVEGLRMLDAAEIRVLEPALRCVRALYSPQTGIVDSNGLMSALRRDAQEAHASFAFGAKVEGGEARGTSIDLRVGGAEPCTVRCAAVVNSAGLWAQGVARSIAGMPADRVPPCHYARGIYFVLAGAAPFRHLIYPIAPPGGLGIHLTLDLAGNARFGPDVEWIDRVDYGFDEDRAPLFEAAIRRYWPGLSPGALRPGYTGIRPRLAPAGSAAQDFLIQGPADHGVPGLVNLFGIESPGLTASLAIADRVAALLS